MSSQTAFNWIISSEKLDPASAGLDASAVHVQGEASGEHLLILKNSQSDSEQTKATESLIKAPSVKSSLLYTEVSGGQGPKSGAGKPALLIVVGLTPPADQEQDLNDWYRDEHITMLSKVPGWIQSQRLKAVNLGQDGPQYLALHFYEAQNGVGSSQEFTDAVVTPWCSKIIDTCKQNGTNGYARWQWQL